VAFAVCAVRSRRKSRPAGAVARAAGGHLVLLVFVRRPKPKSSFGVLRKQSRVAGFAVVLFALQMRGVVEYDIPVFRRQHQLRWRLFGLR
jgi:hypothetical protein